MPVTESQSLPAVLVPDALGRPGLAVDLTSLVEAAAGFAADARAPRTRDAYAKQWRRFTAWAERHGLAPLPADPRVVALYVTQCAEQGLKPASINLALAAIAAVHREHGHASPCSDPIVARVREGVRRRLGVAQNGKSSIDEDDLRAMLRALPETTIGARDRALMLVGYAGALRRSELAAIELRDVRVVPAGIEILVRRSKTDQVGTGQLKVIARGTRSATCPVRALSEWLKVAEITEGLLFRSVDRHGNVGAAPLTGHAVAAIVKRTAARVGLDVATISAHSLRVSFVTNARARGAKDAEIMDQTGHKTLEMVRRYTRRSDAWVGAASAQLGL